MESNVELENLLKELFCSQKFAVLSTHEKGKPYANLMAFAETNSLKQLIFLTSRKTRKYKNLTESDHAALLIDSRSNRETDIHQATAVTVTGCVQEISSDTNKDVLNTYLSKHPYMQSFAHDADSAVFLMKVECYYIVRNFQNVMTLKM